MPTYEYECDRCHRVFEVRQRISEDPITKCETCGGTVRRLLSAAPFILKGGGWYVTDYPSESRKKAMDAEKPAASPTADAKSDAKSSTAAPSTTQSSSTTTASSTPSGSSSTSSTPD